MAYNKVFRISPEAYLESILCIYRAKSDNFFAKFTFLVDLKKYSHFAFCQHN
jgi:hypothetical protein